MGAQMVQFLGDILPELILAAGGIVVLLVALFTPRAFQPWIAAGSVAVLVSAGVFTVFDLADPPGMTFFGTFAVDAATRWTTLLLIVTGVLVVALSVEWFASDARQGEYYFFIVVGTLGAVILAGAADLMELILAMMLSSVAGYTLAAFHRRSRASSEAGMKYFLIGALANAAMVYGVALIFGMAGTTTFDGLRSGLADADPFALSVGFALVVIALAFKIGAVPVHQWVPDVAEGAPAPAAAFIMVAGKVGALVFLARFVAVLSDAPLGWRPLVAIVAALTMTLGNLVALRQDDVRRLLGWSAVSQAGYGLLAVVAIGRSSLAIPSLLMFIVAYALGTLAVFGVVIGLRGLTDRFAYKGLARYHPWLAGGLLIGFLSFVGIPPLGGFVAKLLLIGAVIEADYAWLAVVTVINSAISLVYYLRVLAPSYLESSESPQPVLGHMPGWVVVASALGVIAVGVLAQPLIRLWQTIELLPG